MAQNLLEYRKIKKIKIKFIIVKYKNLIEYIATIDTQSLMS